MRRGVWRRDLTLGQPTSMLLATELVDLFPAHAANPFVVRVGTLLAVYLALTIAFAVVARRVGPYAIGAVWGVATAEATGLGHGLRAGQTWAVLADAPLQARCVVGGALLGVALTWGVAQLLPEASEAAVTPPAA